MRDVICKNAKRIRLFLLSAVLFLPGTGMSVWANEPEDKAIEKNMLQEVVISEKNFPDENFRNLVLEYDTNEDEILDTKESELLTGISIYKSLQDKNLYMNEKLVSDVKSVDLTGIEYLGNVHYISMGNVKCERLDLSKNSYFDEITINGVGLKEIKLPAYSAVEGVINLANNKLTKLDIPVNGHLSSVDIRNNAFRRIDEKSFKMPETTYIESFFFGNDCLSYIKIPNNKIEWACAWYDNGSCNIKKMKIGKNVLYCKLLMSTKNNKYTVLNEKSFYIPANGKLEQLWLEGGKYNDIKIKNVKSLKLINLHNMKVKKMNVINCKRLESFSGKLANIDQLYLQNTTLLMKIDGVEAKKVAGNGKCKIVNVD